MRRPVLKQLFEGSKSIPVERSQDHAKPGVGNISFSDNVTVVGAESKFTEQFKVGDMISFPKDANKEKIEDQIVEKIDSDTMITLKSPGVKASDIE
jgi:hypothetical protein